MCRTLMSCLIALFLTVPALAGEAEEKAAATGSTAVAERTEQAKAPAPAPARCGKCGDGQCVASCGETAQTCPRDCGVPSESLVKQCGEAKPKAE
jgi:hypothetical protein